MLSTLGGLLCALQIASTLARPTAQSTPYAPCSETDTTVYSYANDDGGHIVDGTVFSGGILCVGDGKCSSSLTETYSVSTAITIGTSFSLDITEIFTAGVDFSVTTTTGTSVGEGGTEVCPLGAWHCALAITPYMVEISGISTPDNLCGDAGDPEPYKIQSPHIDSSGNAIISVASCACPDFDGSTDEGAPPLCPGNCK